MRNILRFIVCIIPCEAMEKTIAPARRLPLAADRCSFGAGRKHRHHGRIRRPRDPNQLAYQIMLESTGQAEKFTPETPEKNPHRISICARKATMSLRP